jgi:hypothetical protein
MSTPAHAYMELEELMTKLKAEVKAPEQQKDLKPAISVFRPYIDLLKSFRP